jgi:hypothetical protein
LIRAKQANDFGVRPTGDSGVGYRDEDLFISLRYSFSLGGPLKSILFTIAVNLPNMAAAMVGTWNGGNRSLISDHPPAARGYLTNLTGYTLLCEDVDLRAIKLLRAVISEEMISSL